MSSRKGKCPGCKTLKSNHQFGSPGKHCPGPVEDAVDDTEHEDNLDEPSTSVLLAAIRSLSSQMENIQLQHDTLKKEVKANQSSWDTQAQSTLQTTAPETKQATPPTAGSLAPNITEKTAQSAAKGEYVDFADLLATLSVPSASNVPLPNPVSSDVAYIIKGQRKRQIDSFDTWLQAWNVYEKLVMAAKPERYLELATYREQIQFANRKFCWSPIYMFDIHSRMAYASKVSRDPHARLDILDTTLYATVLDASALRPHPRQCSRCKSFDHLVRDCTFPAPDQMEETSPAHKPSGYGRNISGNRPFGDQLSAWKYAKWFSPSGQEGCNLFQRKTCYQGANCKRAHICKTCRGDHPEADCAIASTNEVPISH